MQRTQSRKRPPLLLKNRMKISNKKMTTTRKRGREVMKTNKNLKERRVERDQPIKIRFQTRMRRKKIFERGTGLKRFKKDRRKEIVVKSRMMNRKIKRKIKTEKIRRRREVNHKMMKMMEEKKRKRKRKQKGKTKMKMKKKNEKRKLKKIRMTRKKKEKMKKKSRKRKKIMKIKKNPMLFN